MCTSAFCSLGVASVCQWCSVREPSSGLTMTTLSSDMRNGDDDDRDDHECRLEYPAELA